MGKMIYLDNAATTKTAPEVVQAMLPYFSEYYGNPSSIYDFAGKSKEAITKGREQIAEVLGAKKEEIYFTAGGSESDNWALKATFEAYKSKGNHIITTKIEHHAILHTAEYLEKRGFEITYLDVDEDGKVKLDDLKAAIRPTTILISVMFANNEIGTIQPIAEIGALCREKGILFHTDAVQAAGRLDIDVVKENIDFLALSAHKFYGPRGVGVLYCRKGIQLTNLIEGGAQERGKRAGTENLPAIAGMAVAFQAVCESREKDNSYIASLRDRLIEGLSQIEHSRLNGNRETRIPGTVNFCFEGIEGESMLLLLDARGIAASSGSACTSGSLDPSHVLLALGLPHEVAHGSLRLSIGAENTPEEMDYIVQNVKEVVSYLREISPVWDELQKGERPHLI